MADLKMKDVFVQVRIAEENFNDAIYYSLEEFEKLSDEDVEAAKKLRFENHVKGIKEASELSAAQIVEQEDQTKRELLSKREELMREVEKIDEKIGK